jgi:acyl carrier protein
MNESRLRESVYQMFADVLGVEASALNDSLSRDEFEAWDSLGHIRLVSEIESKFEISLNVEQIESLHSIAEVIDCVRSLISSDD